MKMVVRVRAGKSIFLAAALALACGNSEGTGRTGSIPVESSQAIVSYCVNATVSWSGFTSGQCLIGVQNFFRSHFGVAIGVAGNFNEGSCYAQGACHIWLDNVPVNTSPGKWEQHAWAGASALAPYDTLVYSPEAIRNHYGHIAVVDHVDGSGNIYVMDSNWTGCLNCENQSCAGSGGVAGQPHLLNTTPYGFYRLASHPGGAGGTGGVSWNCANSAYNGNQYWTCSGGNLYECDSAGTPMKQVCSGTCVSQSLGSNDYCSCGGAPAAPGLPTACGGLSAGQGLTPGQAISSCDGRFDFIQQTDGNLCMYANPDLQHGNSGIGLWCTMTNGYPVNQTVMQSDGNLVQYTNYSCASWNSNTSGHSGATNSLALQSDGNACVYSNGTALWCSNTGGIPPVYPGCGKITASYGLGPGDTTWSCDGRFQLIMQGDGNLVLYGLPTAWSTGTQGKGGRRVAMQGDGNFCIYPFAGAGGAIWCTNTSGHTGAYLAVQNDGNLVIYNSNGSYGGWNSGTCCH